MAMTTEKIREAFAACRALLPACVPPERGGPVYSHLVFMCEEGASYAEHRREKAMRWLGFVQGTLWGLGISTIDEMKSMNRAFAARSRREATDDA